MGVLDDKVAIVTAVPAASVAATAEQLSSRAQVVINDLRRRTWPSRRATECAACR